MTFEEANQVVHPVETQWHYNVLIPAGWVAETKEQVGFVRTYVYTHPDTSLVIHCTTGSSSDYWMEVTHNKAGGYWGTLQKFVENKG